MVEIFVDCIGGDLEDLKLIHQRQINSSQVLTWQHDTEVLKVDKLSEEEALVHEAPWPLKVEHPDTLTD